MTNGSVMKVENFAECSPWSILQYFWPALSDNWSWKAILGLFESARFTQVLLYIMWEGVQIPCCSLKPTHVLINNIKSILCYEEEGLYHVKAHALSVVQE